MICLKGVTRLAGLTVLSGVSEMVELADCDMWVNWSFRDDVVAQADWADWVDWSFWDVIVEWADWSGWAD